MAKPDGFVKGLGLLDATTLVMWSMIGLPSGIAAEREWCRHRHLAGVLNIGHGRSAPALRAHLGAETCAQMRKQSAIRNAAVTTPRSFYDLP